MASRITPLTSSVENHSPLQTAEGQQLLTWLKEFLGGETFSRSRPLDESLFWKLVEEHRLDLIMARAVNQTKAGFSVEFQNRLKDRTQRLLKQHFQLSQAIIQIHKQFEAEKLNYCFLKGPVLGEVLFPGQLLRYSADIDVFVPPEQVMAADSCLRKLGFFPASHRDDLKGRARFSGWLRRDVAYRRAGWQNALELHWRTSVAEAFPTKTVGDFESSCTTENFHGQSIPVWKPELNLTYLCFHAAKHHWSRLRWLVDIVVFVERRTKSWQDTWKLAQKLGVERAVAEAAILANDRLQIPSDLPERALIPHRAFLYSRYALMNKSRNPWEAWRFFSSQSGLYSRKDLRWKSQIFQTGLLGLGKARHLWHRACGISSH